MKKTLLLIAAAVVLLSSCDDNHNRNYGGGNVYVSEPNVVVTPEATNLGDNLDLQALGEMVKSSNNAQDIENKLNTSGSINNLDLDGDGNVDYIKVTEYGDGNARGFSFTVDLPNGEKQEIATVDLQKGSGDVAMNIQGNKQIYGNNSYYQSHYSLSDLMIMHYLFMPHRPYFSPYHYGYYPSYYRSYRSAPVSTYRSRVSSTTRTTKITRTTTRPTSSVKSPNSNFNSKTVNTRSQALANPTRSQKSFSKTSASSSRPKTSGFGNSNRSSSSSSSYRSSTPSRSSSSSSRSSSSRSSFGSSSRSSSSRSGGSRRSDERFKANIVSLNSKSSLDKVCSLQGVTYIWKAKQFPAENFDKKKQIGFIAQDLENVYPEVVNTRADGYKTVDYDLLVPTLVESIKELRKQNAKQDSVIQVLLGSKFTANN